MGVGVKYSPWQELKGVFGGNVKVADGPCTHPSMCDASRKVWLRKGMGGPGSEEVRRKIKAQKKAVEQDGTPVPALLSPQLDCMIVGRLIVARREWGICFLSSGPHHECQI